jgi:uncharacterized protein (DUF885 family)
MNDAKNDSLATVFHHYWEERMKLFPLEATQNGDNRYNDQMTIDFTEGFHDTLRQFYTRYLDVINDFDTATLNATDRTSYDIFKWEMQSQLDALKFKSNAMPFQQFWGVPLTMGQLGSGSSSQPFNTAADYHNWTKRVGRFEVWADSAITYFRKGMVDGTVLPKVLVQKMIPQMNDLADMDTVKNIFFAPLRHWPDGINMAEKDSIAKELTSVLTVQVLPAYKRLADFLQTEYLPKARTSTGISAIPQGGDYYNYLVHYWTTTNMTPEEIYQTGLKEVARIRSEMEKTKASTGFTGDLKAFFQYMRTDPKFKPYKQPKEVLDAFEAIHQRMIPNLTKMFNKVPKSPFEIRQTEAFRAASASAEYNPGTPDGKRPGIFYVPILDATQFNITSGMESLFLHEAIPGHHYQISLQMEDTALPDFRKFAWYGAFGEGWALYCESLGKELGLYTDPYQYMGALGDEMHRAVRLVVDVAMHTKGMTREQAIAYMMENEAIDEGGATAEIERYMAIPGQALSYKIGALKIRELREKYAEQLGSKFSLAAFHDELLNGGVMPLAIAEEKMDRWAAGQK